MTRPLNSGEDNLPGRAQGRMAAAASRSSRSLARVVAKIPTTIAALKTASFGKCFMATAPMAIDDGISIAPGPDRPYP